VLFSAATGLVGPRDVHESLHAFTLRVSHAVPDEFCADPPHAQAERLAPHDPSLRAAAAFEALEDGSPSPPHIGGAFVQQLLSEGSLIAATVGLREDVRSVKAMMSDPSWDVAGGWKEKAALELQMVINEKQALVPLTHEQYRALKAKYQN
jgi:hypothetical protein